MPYGICVFFALQLQSIAKHKRLTTLFCSDQTLFNQPVAHRYPQFLWISRGIKCKTCVTRSFGLVVKKRPVALATISAWRPLATMSRRYKANPVRVQFCSGLTKLKIEVSPRSKPASEKNTAGKARKPAKLMNFARKPDFEIFMRMVLL